MWDMKGSVDVAALGPKALREYAMSCGWTLARAHCRSGSASAISGYLGNGHEFDRAIARFAAAYADLAEADFATFKSALPLSKADEIDQFRPWRFGANNECRSNQRCAFQFSTGRWALVLSQSVIKPSATAFVTASRRLLTFSFS